MVGGVDGCVEIPSNVHGYDAFASRQYILTDSVVMNMCISGLAQCQGCDTFGWSLLQCKTLSFFVNIHVHGHTYMRAWTYIYACMYLFGATWSTVVL